MVCSCLHAVEGYGVLLGMVCTCLHTVEGYGVLHGIVDSYLFAYSQRVWCTVGYGVYLFAYS